jgi:hypothetical protein
MRNHAGNRRELEREERIERRRKEDEKAKKKKKSEDCEKDDCDGRKRNSLKSYVQETV